MVAYSLVAILGATADLGLMWNIAETFNGLMAIPNLIALFLLFRNRCEADERVFCRRRRGKITRVYRKNAG